MSPLIEHDRHKIKDASAARLEAWIKATPVEDVPLNQFGGASRTRICELLHITRSTVGSNAHLLRMFSELDKQIEKRAEVEPSKKRKSTRRTRELEFVAKLVAKAEESELRYARLQYLENYGHKLRE
ncbi:hypothetical protein PQR34_14485 [Paraburkholderia sediminicola]|uniref:hypothetical protein n=1 Tax=Paraburkholderia sediminicola TaxID=458836 RepID=UPI0038BABEAD